MGTMLSPYDVYKERLSDRCRKLKNQCLVIGFVLFVKVITGAGIKSVFFLTFEGNIENANHVVSLLLAFIFFYMIVNFVLLAWQDWRNNKISNIVNLISNMDDSTRMISKNIGKVSHRINGVRVHFRINGVRVHFRHLD